MNIVFFFDQLPKVGKGCFNAITERFSGTVVYAYLRDYKQERKNANWDDGDYGKAKIVPLGEDENTQGKVDALFKEYTNAVFVLGGFKSSVMKYVDRYVCEDKYKFICFSERPGVYGIWWKRLLKLAYIPLSEIRIAKKYRNHVAAMLPLGMTGVKTFRKYGWPQEKLFPFMYDPVETVTDHSIVPVHTPVRFLYVGRFSRYTKGTDTLVKAVDLLEKDSDKFTLTMVGGYGDMRQEILQWLETKPNVEFLGIWDSNTVGTKMKDYDVCVVPSKFDGWNLLVNEAVRAHIGVIVTDEAVSDEVISYSKAGLVVKAKNPKAMAEAMKCAIADKDLVMQWKEKAKAFTPQISNDAVADYMIAIINYVCGDGGECPQCPWLKEIEG